MKEDNSIHSSQWPCQLSTYSLLIAHLKSMCSESLPNTTPMTSRKLNSDLSGYKPQHTLEHCSLPLIFLNSYIQRKTVRSKYCFPIAFFLIITENIFLKKQRREEGNTYQTLLWSRYNVKCFKEPSKSIFTI